MQELTFDPRTGQIKSNNKDIDIETAKIAIQLPYNCNLAFRRLISNDFDVTKTLQYYK